MELRVRGRAARASSDTPAHIYIYIYTLYTYHIYDTHISTKRVSHTSTSLQSPAPQTTDMIVLVSTVTPSYLWRGACLRGGRG